MVLVGQLDHRTAELGEIFLYQIGKFVTGKYGLLLQDAYMTPRIDNFRLNIPICRITEKICIIMKKSCGTYHLPVTCPVHVHHLG